MENSNVFKDAVELPVPEIGTVHARWTLENWRQLHQILSEKDKSFIFSVANVGVFQFSISPEERVPQESEQTFLRYYLSVKVRRLNSNRNPVNVQIYTKASHEPKIDMFKENDVTVTVLSPGKPVTELETREKYHSIRGRLGYNGFASLHGSRHDPRECNPWMTFQMADTIYIHFLIKILPMNELPGNVSSELIPNTFSEAMFYNGGNTDVHLLTSDGVQLPAHHGILHANSIRLGNLFSFNDINEERIVSLPNVSSPILKFILQFVYTGTIEDTNLQSAVGHLSAILEVASNHSMSRLLSYLSKKIGVVCNAGNALELYRLCKKYLLVEGMDAVLKFAIAFPYQCLENWCFNATKDTTSQSSLLTDIAKLARFEKVSCVPTCYSLKAAKCWKLNQFTKHNTLSYMYSFDLPVKDQVTLRFFLNSNGLSVEIIRCSKSFLDNHLLVDYAVEIESIFGEPTSNQCLQGNRHTACSSKFRFLEDSGVVLLDPDFLFFKEIMGQEYRNCEVVSIHIDVEIYFKADIANRTNYQMGKDLIVLQLADGVGLPVDKAKLAERNPVFQAMFYGGLRESSEKVVSIPDLSSAAMIVIVEYIYTENIHENWIQNLEEVLQGATKYMVSGLLSHIDANIGNICTPENCMDLFKLAKFYELQGAQLDIADFLSENVAAVLECHCHNE